MPAHRSRDEHLFGAGPKRILALDGGGIRGALTLGYLARMEAVLAERDCANPDFRLSDYFDLIGGTSTGSIIATGLALGYSVAELTEIYRDLAAEVFEQGWFRFGVFGAKFPKEPLERALRDHFGDETLGSDRLRTGLMVMTKRIDTASPWLLHNNPRGRYYDTRPGGTGTPNRELLLRNIVRASAAAPHYFEPEVIEVAPDISGAFVDGAVSPHNNPALQLLMAATVRGFGLRWPMGRDKLMLVSVGTGMRVDPLSAAQAVRMPALRLAAESIMSIMTDANWLGQSLLQWMSDSPTAATIDAEIGDLSGDLIGDGPALLTYLRYDTHLESDWLASTLGLELTDAHCAEIYAMDDPANVDELTSIGAVAAAAQVVPDHFLPVFDAVPVDTEA